MRVAISFEKAKILRDRVDYTKDDGEIGYIELIDQIKWCKNEYQVTHQVTMKGTYTNRYDVTLLVNGLPLVQIELKRRGLELKEAVQPNQPLPPSFVCRRLWPVRIHPVVCNQQWGKYQILRQQSC